jgi:hypothetical protein
MPRDGSGIYTTPAGTTAVPDTTIESAKYNANVADVAADLNAARPIVAGGTGATSAATARANLDAEVAGVQVTNYDSHVWETGSFWSQSGAIGQPVAAQLAGTCIVLNDDPNYVSLLVRDMGTGTAYTRQRLAGVWSAWINEGATYVNVTGDTMTGHLTLPTGPAAANAVRKDYVDAADALKVAKAGDTMTGALNISNAAGSTAPTNGALIVLGGAGIGGNVSVGSGASVGIGATPGSQPGSGNTALGVDISGAGSVFISRTDNAPLFVARHQFAAAVVFSCLGPGVGSISVNSTSTAYNTSSDERLKEDLKSFDAGNIVDNTNVYDFAWKSTGTRSFGVIAQQAKDIYPHATFHDEKEDRWFIDYSKYVPVILQELKALRARVAELEGGGVIDPKPAR